MLRQACSRCGSRIYFDNWTCLNCGARLGLLPDLMHLTALDPAGGDLWAEAGRAQVRYRLCINAVVHGVCNGLVPADESGQLCRACEFTQQIPSLSTVDHLEYWRRLERAKRRLLFTLAALHLPLEPRARVGNTGLGFAFGADVSPAHRFLTAHCDGLISINISEADDVERERIRTAMGEPYRTLLGHFRHESGHHYLERFAEDPARLTLIRATFGEVRNGYEEALSSYYANGPLPHWQESHISAYATAHPQEDWAETWAHYLLIVDTLESAHEAGVVLGSGSFELSFGSAGATYDPASFDLALARWLPLAEFANELARSLGTADAYPFVLTDAVTRKMRVIDRLVAGLSQDPLKSSHEKTLSPL
ncbi:MAG: putative zinc-binding metallopeptidase [Proteobacteria bacterium]|nr:putative zinc-binding metallopeptidase [Burkholderiales bacterium]